MVIWLEFLENNDLEKAINYSKKALEIQEDLVYVQANLGLFPYLIENEKKSNKLSFNS
jgi:hypothetical protein